MATEKENLVTSINECNEVLDEKVSEISKIASTALEIQQQIADLDIDDEITQSRTSHALSLYSKVSNISWEYSAPPGILAGCKCGHRWTAISLICCTYLGYGNDDTREITAFEFNMTKMDSFEIANALWDVIGQGVPHFEGV
jgi:hypothetical protein